MSDELHTIVKLRYTKREGEKKPKENKQPAEEWHKFVGHHDELSRLISLKYASHAKKSHIFPVDIDFPLPNEIEGSDKRTNKALKYEVPKELSLRRQPTFLIGEVLRCDEVLRNYKKYIGKDIVVAGWANSTRLQGKDTLIFVELMDGTSPNPIQVVITDKVSNWEEVKKAKKAYSFRIRGKLIESLGGGQAIELNVSGEGEQFVKILGKCDDKKYPLGGYKFTNEFLRDIAHLRIRTRINGAVARVKNSLAYSTHLFFQNNGFTYVKTPIITTSDCEGAGEMFQVTTVLPQTGLIKDIPHTPDGKIDYSQEFFKKSANLTVSGQLAVENYACALSNVYTFGPTFRAEVSHTTRHIAEFWMIEPEICFADVYDVIDCAEAYVKYCIDFILNNNVEDLKFLDEHVKKGLVDYLKHIVAGPFARSSYTQAIEILKKVIAKGVKFENEVEWGIDLASEHEKYLCDHVFHRPTILYNYPKDIKAFYMRLNDDGKTVASFDVLAPEVITY